MIAAMFDATRKLLRPHFRDLEGYVSAGMESDKSADRIFMNANENPYTLPGLEDYNRYPEPQPRALLDAYARIYHVKPEQILATRGADEAIVILTKFFCEPHQDAIVIHPPTFGMYKVDAAAMPCHVKEVPLIRTGNSFSLDKESLIAAGKEADTKLVYLCSPNNPTGTSFPLEDMLEITTALEGHALVVIDEAYIEVSKQRSVTPHLLDHPNMVVLRTLSKAYALAGLRMGSLISGDKELIALMRQKGLDAYPLPVSSIKLALKALAPEMQETAQAHINKLLAGRDSLKQALEKNPAIKTIFESDANFLLVEFDNPKAVLKAASDQGIILRDMSSRPGTENCIRISAGTQEQNEKLLSVLTALS